jgi:hypothetical protein
MPIEIPTKEKLARWEKQKAEMPQSVQDIANRFDPWGRYEMEDTGQIVRIESFHEDGTLLVWVDPEFNDPDDWRIGYEVFGIDPDNLTPWLPKLDG